MDEVEDFDLAQLDTSALAFKGGFYAYVIGTEISCAGPYLRL